MQLFEVTLLLLAAAVVLMAAARRLRVPYPSLLALVGGCFAALPFAPRLSIEPRLALALFVAPAVMDSAFELPPRELLRNWVPLVPLAVMLVLATAAAMAWVGVGLGSLLAFGITMRPLLAWLRIAKDSSLDEEVARTRNTMLAAALEAIRHETGPIVDEVRRELKAARRGSIDRARPTTSYDELRRRGLEAERRLLNGWRYDGRIPDDVYHPLEDELDRTELDLASSGASWLEN